MRLYLDACCFNRPFDDASQDRIAIEGEAVLRILARVESGDWELAASDALLFELRRNPDEERRNSALELAGRAGLHVRSDPVVTREAVWIASLGFKSLDAAHLAFARAGGVDVFLTVDDQLLRRARSVGKAILPVIANPASWLVALQEGEKP